MEWILAAPYGLNLEQGLWKTVPERNHEIKLHIAPKNYEHDRSRTHTNQSQWRDYWQHSKQAYSLAKQYNAGIITMFPQLAACTAMRKKLNIGCSTPLIASTFNLGTLNSGLKQMLAQSTLKHIDLFIVPSSPEVQAYSQYLDIPEEKFEFIPLHKPLMPSNATENKETPFILSMGTANRDYDTLFQAIRELPYRLIVVCPPERLAHLNIPKNVEIKSNLTIESCRTLVQQAKLNIIPIQNKQTASGQITVIEAMMFNKAVIATQTIGTLDYIEHKKTGWLVKEQSVEGLKQAITTLWEDKHLRDTLANNAYQFVKNELSYEKTADKLNRLLTRFC